MNACRWSGCCHIAWRYRRCAVLSVADCRICEIHQDYGVFGDAKYRVGSPAPVTSRLPAERSVAMVYCRHSNSDTYSTSIEQDVVEVDTPWPIFEIRYQETAKFWTHARTARCVDLNTS